MNRILKLETAIKAQNNREAVISLSGEADKHGAKSAEEYLGTSKEH